MKLKQPFIALLRVLFSRHIVSVVALMTMCVVAVVYALARLDCGMPIS